MREGIWPSPTVGGGLPIFLGSVRGYWVAGFCCDEGIIIAGNLGCWGIWVLRIPVFLKIIVIFKKEYP